MVGGRDSNTNSRGSKRVITSALEYMNPEISSGFTLSTLVKIGWIPLYGKTGLTWETLILEINLSKYEVGRSKLLHITSSSYLLEFKSNDSMLSINVSFRKFE